MGLTKVWQLDAPSRRGAHKLLATPILLAKPSKVGLSGQRMFILKATYSYSNEGPTRQEQHLLHPFYAAQKRNSPHSANQGFSKSSHNSHHVPSPR